MNAKPQNNALSYILAGGMAVTGVSSVGNWTQLGNLNSAVDAQVRLTERSADIQAQLSELRGRIDSEVAELRRITDVTRGVVMAKTDQTTFNTEISGVRELVSKVIDGMGTKANQNELILLSKRMDAISANVRTLMERQ